MSKFVLDCGAVSSIGSNIQSIGSQMSEMSGVISGYNISEVIEFNFSKALRAISSNIDDSTEKINNTVKAINKIIETHTNLQGSLSFTPNVKSAESEVPIEQTQLNDTSKSDEKISTPNKDNSQTIYVVMSGDNLSKIAAENGISLATLIAANPQIKNPRIIHSGDKVTIPSDNIKKDSKTQPISKESKTETKQENTSKQSNNERPSTKVNGKEVSARFTAYYPADNAMEGGFKDCKGYALDPSKNTCAVPPDIPYGTKIQINGTGTELDGKIYTVTDRGGAIKKESDGTYHFDILMSSNKECNNWGNKRGTATIIS